MEFIVSIDIKGKPVAVGSISGESSADARFTYAADYLNAPEAVAISFSLPLRSEPFSAEQTKCFFDGLLPEGFTRRAVASNLHLDENDYVQILYQLGRECIGALRVYQKGETPQASYDKLTHEQVRELAREGATESAAVVIESRLSLAGATGKVGLYRDPKTGEWYLPRGTAPSTHIVKQSHVRLERIVPNELLCLLTAKQCGIDVPETTIIDLGSGEDEDILLASERFDRRFSEQSAFANELPMPLRLHQEDFAQALGIPASRKYENGDRHLAKMFALLRTHSSQPIEDQLKLWDRIVFNCLIGNTDGHLKNYSLLYGEDLKTVRLAPAYDVINTVGYKGMTHEMSFMIGNAKRIEDVTRDSFRMAAREAGLGERMALNRLDEMTKRFRPALESAAGTLIHQGIKGVEELRATILDAGSEGNL